MADEAPGDACVLAVRMATGDAFTDEEIRENFTAPLRNEVKMLEAQAGPTADAAATIDEAAMRLARLRIKEALIKAKQAVLTEKATTARQVRVAARMRAIKNPVKAAQSFLIGSDHRAWGAGWSTHLKGVTYGDHMVATFMSALNEVEGLANRLSSLVGLNGETGFTRDVAREVARLNGDTSQVPPGQDIRGGHVSAAARAVKALYDEVRERQNAAGAAIDKYPGYIGKLHHDATLISGGFWVHQKAAWKLAKDAARELSASDEEWRARVDDLNFFRRAQMQADRMGFTPWKDFLLGKDIGRARLLPETFDGVGYEDLASAEKPTDRYNPAPETPDAPWDPAARDAAARAEAKELGALGLIDNPDDLRELFLYRIYERITAQRHLVEDATSGKDFVPQGGNLGLRLSKAKVLRMSVDDEMDYRQKYTRMGYLQAAIETARRAGGNVALMEDFGPNPQEGFKDFVQQLDSGATNLSERRRLAGSAVGAPWEILTGRANIPVSLRLAELSQNLRAWQRFTKLGSVVMSKPADYSFLSSTGMRYGMKWLQTQTGLAKAFARMNETTAKQSARAAGAGIRNLQGRFAGTHVADDARPGLMARWSAQAYGFSGFAFLNDKVERSAVNMLQQYLAQQKDVGWGALDPAIRQRLSEFEIGEREWDTARQAPMARAEDGEEYFTTEGMDELAKEDPSLEQEVYRTKSLFDGYFHDAMRLAMNEPTPRSVMASRAPLASLGLAGPVLRPGTFEGEIGPMLFQFKNFVATAYGRHFLPAASELMRGNAGPMAHLMLSMTLTGFMAMQLKALIRGEDPRTPQNLIDAHPGMSTAAAWGRVWGSALAQGGGLGLLGDFLFGELDRNNAEFGWTSFLGPMAGQSEQVMQAFQHAVTGNDIDPETGKRQLPGEVIRLAGSNIPVINTWYTRLAIDYLVLWRLQELASPGYLERYQQRQEDKGGARYWWAPTQPPLGLPASPYGAAGVP